MSVQSARVQEIIKGDDVILAHQIMQDVAFDAEISRGPVMVNSGDVVKFYYPLQDPSATDLIGYPGTPVGSYPTSKFDVAIPGNIAASGSVPARGSKTFQSGLGRTVRAEITRLIESPTGNTDGSTGVITSVSNMTGLQLGQSVAGVGIPPLSIIIEIGVNQFTINNNTTAIGVGIALAIGEKETHYLIQEVDISERGFPNSLTDTSGGTNPPQSPLNLP